MSETNTEATIPLFVTVEKNGVPMDLKVLKETKGKGAAQGNTYVGVEETFSLAQLTSIMGENFVTTKLQGILKANLKECEEEVTTKKDKDGNVIETFPLDATKFKGAWETWSFVNESLKTLNDKVMGLIEQMLAIPDDNSAESKAQEQSLKAQMKAIKADIDRKKRVSAKESAGEAE